VIVTSKSVATVGGLHRVDDILDVVVGFTAEGDEHARGVAILGD
jgi:hypothetical protein